MRSGLRSGRGFASHRIITQVARRSAARAFERFVSVGLISALLLALPCGCSRPAQEGRSAEDGSAPVHYTFAGVDGDVISSEMLRGRVTVLLFVTTFDIASQAQARRLEDLYRSHTPRINAAAIVLEAPRYVDLARTFRDSLELSYPVGISAKQSLEGQGFFSHVHSVPTWIFLDPRGRVRYVAAGALTPEGADEQARRAQ